MRSSKSTNEILILIPVSRDSGIFDPKGGQKLIIQAYLSIINVGILTKLDDPA